MILSRTKGVYKIDVAGGRGGDGFTSATLEKSTTPPKSTQKKIRHPLNRFEKKYTPHLNRLIHYYG